MQYLIGLGVLKSYQGKCIFPISHNLLLEKSLHKVFMETRKNHKQMNALFGYESGIHYHTAMLEVFRQNNPQEAHDRMSEYLEEAMRKITNMSELEQ